MTRMRQAGAKAAANELQGLGAEEFSSRLMSLDLIFQGAYRSDAPNFSDFNSLLSELDRRMRDPQLLQQLDLSAVEQYLTAVRDTVSAEIGRLRPQADSSDARERFGYIEPLMATLEFTLRKVQLALNPALGEQVAAAASPEEQELARQAPVREPGPVPIVNQGYLTFQSGMSPSEVLELATHLGRLMSDPALREELANRFMNGLIADDMGYGNKAEFGRMIIEGFAQGFGMSADHLMDFANWTDGEMANIMERFVLSDLAFIQRILSLINSGEVRDALQESQGHGTLGNTLAEIEAVGLSMLGVRVLAAQFQAGMHMTVYENQLVEVGLDFFMRLGLIQNLRLQGDFNEETGEFSNLRLAPQEGNEYDMDWGAGGGGFLSFKLADDRRRATLSVQGSYSEYHGPEIRARVQFSDTTGDIFDGFFIPAVYGEVTASGPDLGNIDTAAGTQLAMGIFSSENGCFFITASVDWLRSWVSETTRAPIDATNVGVGGMWVSRDYSIEGKFFYDVEHPDEGQMGAMLYGNFAAGEHVNVGIGPRWDRTIEPYTGEQVNRFMLLGGVDFDLYGLIFGR